MYLVDMWGRILSGIHEARVRFFRILNGQVNFDDFGRTDQDDQ